VTAPQTAQLTAYKQFFAESIWSGTSHEFLQSKLSYSHCRTTRATFTIFKVTRWFTDVITTQGPAPTTTSI
jgi:hypothetical protein